MGRNVDVILVILSLKKFEKAEVITRGQEKVGSMDEDLRVKRLFRPDHNFLGLSELLEM